MGSKKLFETSNELFGARRIRVKLKEKGYTVGEIADALEEDKAYIGQILSLSENDEDNNEEELLNKIKQATDLPLVKNTSDVNRLKNPVIKNQWDRELLFDKIFNLF